MIQDTLIHAIKQSYLQERKTAPCMTKTREGSLWSRSMRLKLELDVDKHYMTKQAQNLDSSETTITLLSQSILMDDSVSEFEDQIPFQGWRRKSLQIHQLRGDDLAGTRLRLNQFVVPCRRFLLRRLRHQTQPKSRPLSNASCSISRVVLLSPTYRFFQVHQVATAEEITNPANDGQGNLESVSSQLVT